MQPTNAPFLTPKRAEHWRSQHAAAARPAGFIERPADSLAYRLAMRALRVIAVLLVLLVVAVWFFLFGEEHPERVRPALTPAQRARAFRLPHP